MSLDPTSSVPLYVQIQDYLKKQIKQDAFHAGSRLPSERELSETLGVSRMTVRQALHALTHENVIFSQTGKGYYIRKPKIDQELGVLTSFSEEMNQRGVVPNSRVITDPACHAGTLVFICPSRTEIVFQRIRSLTIIRSGESVAGSTPLESSSV
jgi:DNA-binding GntR family transcriptional regulator